jgi:hypothetical protein
MLASQAHVLAESYRSPTRRLRRADPAEEGRQGGDGRRLSVEALERVEQVAGSELRPQARFGKSRGDDDPAVLDRVADLDQVLDHAQLLSVVVRSRPAHRVVLRLTGRRQDSRRSMCNCVSPQVATSSWAGCEEWGRPGMEAA